MYKPEQEIKHHFPNQLNEGEYATQVAFIRASGSIQVVDYATGAYLW